MRICTVFMTAAFASIVISSCKKDNNSGGPGGGNFNYDPGAIYIRQGTEGITRINMSTGELSTVMGNWSDAGWDVSWDGTMGVKQINRSANYETKYLIFNTSNGSTIREVNFEPNDNNGGLPAFSPDGSMLALRPTLRDGLVILGMNGNVIKHVAGYGNDHEFEYLDPINWTPDGGILFKKGNSLYRTTTNFASASKIREVPFSDWRGAAVASPDGKKIALSAGGHIWLMNADGSDFHQITESNQSEVAPSFSPDSRYIAIKANSRAGLPGDGFGTAHHLCLVPADGQVYKVYPGEDDRVIQVIIKGTSPGKEGLGKAIVGDFVWRR